MENLAIDLIIEVAQTALWADIMLFGCIIVLFVFCVVEFSRMGKAIEKLKNQKGFTLIELVTIVAIIGTLAAIAISQFANYRSKAYDDMAMSDLRGAVTCQEAFFTDRHTYATDEAVLKADYNMYESQGVDVIIQSADDVSFVMDAKHEKGLTTYTYNGPGGSITKK